MQKKDSPALPETGFFCRAAQKTAAAAPFGGNPALEFPALFCYTLSAEKMI